MPLWTIHHTPGIFSDEEKHQLASRITDHYERIGLPRFYVITMFNETRPEDFYVGGEPNPVGVRILIDHIAGTAPIRKTENRSPAGSSAYCIPTWKSMRDCTGNSTPGRPARTSG